MSGGEEEDDLDITMPSVKLRASDPLREVCAVFDDIEELLKNGDVVGALSVRGINASLGLVAVQGLRAYLAGKKAQAADDFGLVAEEIRARLSTAPRGDVEAAPPEADEHDSIRNGTGERGF